MSPNGADKISNAVRTVEDSRLGKRRRHPDLECSDSCDCDEFAGAPLAKKINSLQINKSNLQNNTESQVGFEEIYNFPADSAYFSSNRMLKDLYLARIKRRPDVAHYPTE